MAKRPPTQRKKPLGSQVSATTQINVTEVSTMAERLESSGDRQGAISLYRSWLKSTKNSGTWIVWFNLGVLLRAEGDIESSIDAYKQSLEANPSSVHARINLGTALELVGQIDEAMAQWRNGLLQLDREENPSPELLCAVLNNLGRRLEVAQQYTEAEAMLTRSLRLNPKQDAVLYHRIYLRQKQCAWPIYDSLPGITEADQRHSTSAVAMLSITDDPVIQRGTALTQVPGKIPPNLPRLAPVGGYQHQRLRIGYLSSNFGMHAVSILTAELYELHDRSQFEVWGFCWSPEDNTEMRARVIGAMDHFVRINTLSDEAAAHAIRAAEIDILIDLQGLTSGCRPSILAYRPAPVQATYLGFPGTTGLPGVDYVLADRYIIPDESAHFFTETPIYLPDCFQVNDRKRISAPPKSRTEYGLPEGVFVFCAFNNNIKFTPEFFSVWMRILQRTSNTVLWLLADNDRARENLSQYADAHGVARERLIFAPRVSVADYLGRFAAADLFLDLFPFNGGTTVADALWMGLPIVTCSGRSFASRMAGSLLQAIGLPELITTSPDDYVDLAVSLANDVAKVRALRERITRNKDTHPLFDTPKLVRHIESALADLVKAQQGLTVTSSTTEKLVVYTVLIGDKEALNDPLRLIDRTKPTDLQIEYICLTDNPGLTSPTWRMQLFEHPLIAKEKLSRLPKTQPHLFFPDYTYSLYIDNTVVFKRHPQASDLAGGVFKAFRHPWRSNPVDEADIVVKSGLDLPEVVANQFISYQRNGLLNGITSLTAGTVLMRAHHDPAVKQFGEYWWQQVLLHSKRDQLSIDVCAKAAKCSVDYFAGDKRNNDLFLWPAPVSDRRVLGSFDDALYAWDRRSEPDAQSNPRAHFLAHATDEQRYVRHPSWLSYLCDRVGSSLGTITPPRRGIAHIVETTLAPGDQIQKKILLVGIVSAHCESANAAELEASRKALQLYLRFTTPPIIIEALISSEQLQDSVPFRSASGHAEFDLVIALAVQEHTSPRALSKFQLLLRENGRLLLQFQSSLAHQAVTQMRDNAAMSGRLDAFHRTDLWNGAPIGNSVFLYSNNS